jgi:hypothetical protein
VEPLRLVVLGEEELRELKLRQRERGGGGGLRIVCVE